VLPAGSAVAVGVLRIAGQAVETRMGSHPGGLLPVTGSDVGRKAAESEASGESEA
jgi:hypothetical protein